MSKIIRATIETSHVNLTIRAPTGGWLSDLDRWRDAQPVPPKRADVIKLAVIQFLDRQAAQRAASKR